MAANFILLASLLLMLSKKNPTTSVETQTTPSNAQIMLYHQLALDMNNGSLTRERAETLLGEVQQFLNRFPETPHLPVLNDWKRSLEEMVVRSKRQELRDKELQETAETKKLSHIAEKEIKVNKK
jgi:transcriptional regulator with GAF, ATPase, and Fis domain